ncbi:MAG: hypothetical protein CFH43_00941, partial [Proteobacteria bacterium]
MPEPKTFRMPKINYYVRKHFRTKILVLDLDDTIMPWPRNMPLKNGKHLNLNAYVSNVFAKIASEVLGLDRDEAYELCSSGYFNYGSAIIGLLETPDYDVTEEQAHEIFMRVHQQTATNPSKGVVAWAKPNFKLYYLLSQFKTVPYIITHGSTPYAKIALQCMGLLNTVVPEENVFGLELYGYYNTKNKPNPYIWFQQKTGIPFNRMVMSEDSHKNLFFAKALGIKTVLLHQHDWPLASPVIELHTQQQLMLSFDDLDSDVKDYYYTVLHCTKDWEVSDLMPTDYINGFIENGIADYAFSFNTLEDYTHFELAFPNEDIKLNYSGNYVIKVYLEGNAQDPVITKRFMVVDPKVKVMPHVKQATLTDDRNYKQEVDFTILHKGYDVLDPYGEIAVRITQNNRWDNAISGLQPTFVRDQEL